MKEGLEEFLKRIEAKPTNETLIDRFVTLVLEEDVLERILYLKKLVGLLLTPNPYAALKAAALELQEARKEKLTKEYEIGALKDVESCFLKLDKIENVQLIREEINKLHSELNRESTATRARTAPPPHIPQVEEETEQPWEEVAPHARQARVHFRLPQSDDDEDEQIGERNEQHRPAEYDMPIPAQPKANQRNTPSTSKESFAQSTPAAPVSIDFNTEDFGYSTRKKNPPPEEFMRSSVQKEFYDKSLEETDDDPGEQTHRSTLSKISGIKVGPNLLDHPDDQEQPVRTRNMASVFESTDVFSPSQSGHSRSIERNSIADRYPLQDEKRPAKSASLQTKVDRPPGEFLVSDDEIADSDAMYKESQHVHFPENSSNRSMVKQEMRGHLNSQPASSQWIDSTPMEDTQILPDSWMASSPMNFDNEVTQHLSPADLMHSWMPVFPAEPAFPPRDFDIPPYELAPSPQEIKAQQKTSQTGQETPQKLRQPIPLSREPSQADRDVLPFTREPEPIANDPFAPIRSAHPLGREASLTQRDSNDPFAVRKQAAAMEARFPQREAFAAMREMPADESPYTQREAPARDLSGQRTPPSVAPAKPMAASFEPRWNLLRDRLRLLTGVQISRSQASDFVLRLLGENASRAEQQEVLSIFLHMLDTTRQPAAELRFLAFLFEELQPKSLHQLMGALKIGDQTVVFFVDYLQTLLKERQLRRILNIIHAVIVPGLDLSWYQEAYRFLLIIWPELGLKGWYWQAEEGPMVFCDLLADREDLMPATLLA